MNTQHTPEMIKDAIFAAIPEDFTLTSEIFHLIAVMVRELQRNPSAQVVAYWDSRADVAEALGHCTPSYILAAARGQA